MKGIMMPWLYSGRLSNQASIWSKAGFHGEHRGSQRNRQQDPRERRQAEDGPRLDGARGDRMRRSSPNISMATRLT
jgi:hypothetical protein